MRYFSVLYIVCLYRCMYVCYTFIKYQSSSLEEPELQCVHLLCRMRWKPRELGQIGMREWVEWRACKAECIDGQTERTVDCVESDVGHFEIDVTDDIHWGWEPVEQLEKITWTAWTKSRAAPSMIPNYTSAHVMREFITLLNSQQHKQSRVCARRPNRKESLACWRIRSV